MRYEEMRTGTPLLAAVPESTKRDLYPQECRVHECGEDRMGYSFFCEEDARLQSPASVALMIGGLVVSSTGEILSEGKLHIIR